MIAIKANIPKTENPTPHLIVSGTKSSIPPNTIGPETPPNSPIKACIARVEPKWLELDTSVAAV
jgi:hypothetical protein